MYQFDDPTAVSALPAPAAAGTPGYFTDGNPATNTPATLMRSDFMNMLMMELLNVVTAAGIAPSKTTYNQVLSAIQQLSVSAVEQALAYKVPALVATTGANIALSGLQTIDGVLLVAGNRVLVKDQSNPQQNGIYVAAAGAWSLASDVNTAAELVPAMLVPVQSGTVNADTVWQLKTQAPIVIGTSNILFQEVAANLAQYALLSAANVFTQPQSVPSAVQPQHAINLGQFAAAPLSFRNLLVNGAMRVAQQYGSVLQTPSNATWVIDQWVFGTTQSGKFTFQQVSGPLALGFDTYAQFTVASAYTSGAADYFTYQQLIEAANLTALCWGTANARPVSLQFVVNSSVAGTFSGSLRNAAATRSYPFTFTISQANTDTLIQIPNIPGDTGGSWILSGAVGGLLVTFDLGSGTSFRGNAGSWQAGSFTGVTSAVSLVGTVAATFKVTGVQLELGSSCTSFERPTPDAENARCQRYLPAWVSTSTSDMLGGIGYAATTTSAIFDLAFRVTPRAPVTGLVLSSAAHFTVQTAAGTFAATAVNFGAASANAADMSFITSGLTAGSPCRVYFNNAAGKLLFTGPQL
jgi:hypothetical protein